MSRSVRPPKRLPKRLPKRQPQDLQKEPHKDLHRELPTGTRYVVEGRAAGDGQFRVSARYLVYPDGQRVDVPGETVLPISCCAKCADEAQAKRSRVARRSRQPVDAGLQLGV